MEQRPAAARRKEQGKTICMEKLATLSHKEVLKLDKDYSKSARMADLVYVTDKDPGIRRMKKGAGFVFYEGEKRVTDEATLQRIKALVIPPAWTDVWICGKANGHIQATGSDAKGRKQYRYHPHWEVLRNETKFHRMYEFGKVLPAIRLQVESDLGQKELSEAKVLATVVSLMERTFIRVGNDGYEKLYGSYGLTTLKDKHVKVSGHTVQFSFKGKKGVYQNITLRNRKLARLVQMCRDIPGKELFQYFDERGERRSIDSGMVNRYIKDASGGDFTAKDFRTWAGTLHLLQTFCNMEHPEGDTACKKNVLAALDEVSAKLGNTRTVCKKYYVHPGIIRLYEERSLQKYLKELDAIEKDDHLSGLTSEERMLMKILKELM
jgi:DNA topoisomerase-1